MSSSVPPTITGATEADARLQTGLTQTRTPLTFWQRLSLELILIGLGLAGAAFGPLGVALSDVTGGVLIGAGVRGILQQLSGN